MAIDEKQFKRIKAQADAARVARDKAAGALDATMQQLKRDFGVDTVADAEELLTELRKRAARAEKSYNTEVDAFMEKWNDKITPE